MNVLYGVLIVAGASAIAIAAMMVVRRKAPEGSYFADSDRASGVFGVLATGFAILLGFIVFLAFTTYDESRAGAEAEALVLLQQVETAQFLPADVASELSGELTCYGRYVVHQEWPALERGDDTEDANPWGIAVFETVRTVQTETPEQETAYAKFLDQTSEREQARLDRVHGAEGILPGPLWIALFAIAAVIFVFMLFYADANERALSQAYQIGAVVAVIVATLLIIRLFNEPFTSDPGGLEPVAMERTLDVLDGLAGLVELGELPCGEDGLPA